MGMFVVYLSSEERPKIIRARQMIVGEEDFEFIFEGGDSLVFKKAEVICWDEFADGQTAVIRSREDAIARVAASFLSGPQGSGGN